MGLLYTSRVIYRLRISVTRACKDADASDFGGRSRAYISRVRTIFDSASALVNDRRAHLNAHFLRNPPKSLRRRGKAFQLRGMRLAPGISATTRYIYIFFPPPRVSSLSLSFASSRASFSRVNRVVAREKLTDENLPVY